MARKDSKGLTLIELLVVMAIIALLSSFIMVSLLSARDNARDSAVIKTLSQVRITGQMIFIESGKYSDNNNLLCASNTLNVNNINHPELKNILDRVNLYNGSKGILCNISAAGDNFCVRSPLNRGGYFCTDSTGQATTLKTTCDATAECK